MYRIIVIATALIFLSAAGGAFFLHESISYSRGDAIGEIRFSFSKGESVASLADRLDAANLIDYRLVFLYYIWKEDLKGKLQAGDYLFQGGMTIPEIVAKLVSGDIIPLGTKVTFPEGWTAREIAARLEQNGFSGEKFLELVRNPKAEWLGEYPFLLTIPKGGSLEGFLFPDTYFFDPKLGEEKVIEKMLENFGKKTPIRFDHSFEAGIEMRDKLAGAFATLTLASIVEAEVRTEHDRKMVADLFIRRIGVGMPLQSDATVRYALGVTKVQHSLDDIAINSPYNTYQYPGLPPGPIGNPGTQSMNAVLHPTPNPYWYFLNDPETGETVFARTFEEHKTNKEAHGL